MCNYLSEGSDAKELLKKNRIYIYDEKAKNGTRELIWSELNDIEKLKYEIANELGLLDKIKETGWKNLTAKETGRIGGLVTKRRKEREKRENREQCTKENQGKI